MNSLSGIDYEWLCMDSVGNLAVLITGGEAPVPDILTNNLDINEHLIKYIEMLPENGGYSLHSRDFFKKASAGKMYTFTKIGDSIVPDDAENQERLRDFIKFSRKGLFAYDWPDIHRPTGVCSNQYELISSPTKALKFESLPVEIRSLIDGMRLNGIDFRKAMELDIKALLRCS